MQAQREAPSSYTDCKDKFLVQSCIVTGDAKDISGDVFEKAGGEMKQTKLRVVLVSPPKPPSPVPEGIEEDNSPTKDLTKQDDGDRELPSAATGEYLQFPTGHRITQEVLDLIADVAALQLCPGSDCFHTLH